MTNTPEQDQVLLKKLNQTLIKFQAEIQQMKEKQPEVLKTWLKNKANKEALKNAKLAGGYLKQIKKLKAAQANASDSKKQKLEDKIDVLEDKALDTGDGVRGVNVEDGEDDVKWCEFKKTVLEFFSKAKLDENLAKVKTADKKVIDVAKLIEFANNCSYDTPLGKELGTALIKELNGKTTVEEVKKVFKTVQGIYIDKKNLRPHYNTNKAAYRTDEKGNILYGSYVSGDILTFFSVLAEVDKEQEGNATDEETKAAEEKAKKEQFDQEFLEYLESLRKDVNQAKIGNPTASPDTLIVDTKTFFSKYNLAVAGAKKTGKPTIGSMKGFLEGKLGSKTNSTVSEVKTTVNTWTNQEYKTTTWYDEQFELWKSGSKQLPSPSLIANAIHESYIDVDADTIFTNLRKWTTGVKSAFVFEKSFCVDRDKLKKQFEEQFEETTSGGLSIDFIYTDFIKTRLEAAPKEATTEELQELVWEKMIEKEVVLSKITDYFKNKWLDIYGPHKLKQFNEEIDSLLPGIPDIQQALRNSKCTKRTLKESAEITHDSIRPLIKIGSSVFGKGRTVDGHILVDLEYKNFKLPIHNDVQDVWLVVPKKGAVEWIPIENNTNAQVTLIDSKVKKTKPVFTQSCETDIELRFMVLADTEKLLGLFDMDNMEVQNDDGTKTFNWGEIIRNFTVSKGFLEADVESFIEQNTDSYFINATLNLRSSVENNNRTDISLSSFLKTQESNWNFTFGATGTSELLGANSPHFYPTYDYK